MKDVEEYADYHDLDGFHAVVNYARGQRRDGAPVVYRQGALQPDLPADFWDTFAVAQKIKK